MSLACWESCGVTHPGKIRNINQDAYLDLASQQLWLVADGMGGHKDGEYASNAIVDAFKTFELEKTIGATISSLYKTLQGVNLSLYQLANQAGGHDVIGSTVAILLAYRQYCISLWSGDSRIYLFRKGKLIQITNDHNYESFLLSTGVKTEILSTHPLAQSLTHAIGSEKECFLEAKLQEIRPKDIFLLCSDGLNKEVPDAEIEARLQDTPSVEAANQLLDLCLSRGARDNVTITTVRCKAIDSAL